MPYSKAITAAAATALFLVAITGCAPGGAQDPDDPGTSGKLDKSMSGELNYWSWAASEQAQEEIDAFNEVYPNIEVTYKQLSNYPEYVQQLTPGLLSNEGPDVFAAGDNYVRQYTSYLRDLTPLAEQELGEDWRSQLGVGAVDAFTVDGELVAAPGGSEFQGAWLVNRTLLDKLGVDAPAEDWSLADLEEWCAQLESGGADCVLLGGQASNLTQGVVQQLVSASEPGAWAAAVAGERSWEDEPFATAFDTLATLSSDGVFQAGAVGAPPYPDLWQAFLEQKAGAIVLGTWTLNTYGVPGMTTSLESSGLDPEALFTTELITVPDLVETGNPSQMPSVNVGVGINGKTKNLAAAEAFVAWRSFSAEGQQYIADTLSLVPAMTGVVPNSIEYIDETIQAPALADISEAATSSSEVFNVPCADLATAINLAMQKVLTGESVGSALAELQATSASVDRAEC